MLERHADIGGKALKFPGPPSPGSVKPDPTVGLFFFTGKKGSPGVCGPVGNKGEYCIKVSCTIKSHKSRRAKEGGPAAGLYIMTGDERMLLEPHVDKSTVQLFGDSVSRVLNTNLPLSGALGLMYTMNSVQASGLTVKDKKAQVFDYVESLCDTMDTGKPVGLTPVKDRGDTTEEDQEMRNDEEADAAYKAKVLKDLKDLQKSVLYEQGVTNGMLGHTPKVVPPVNARLQRMTDETEKLTRGMSTVQANYAQLQAAFDETVLSHHSRLSSCEKKLGRVESNTQGNSSSMSKMQRSFETLLTSMESLAQQVRSVQQRQPAPLPPQASFPLVAPLIDMTPLQTQIDALQEELQRVQSRDGYIMLESGAIRFENQKELAKVVGNVHHDLAYLFAPDPSIMLQRVTRESITDEQVRSEQIHEQKTGLSDDLTKLMIAYRSVIPSIFVGGSDTKGSTTARMELNAVNTPTKWDSGNGNDGINNLLRKQLSRVKADMERSIDLRLVGHPELSSLAKGNVKRSYNFLQDLLRFMNEQYRELLVKCYGEGPYTKTQKGDIWDLMLLMFRVVWETLWETRQLAQFAYAEPTTASVVYLETALKTHMQMEVFIERGFIEHAGIFPKLTRHLFETTVSKERFDALVQRFEAVVTELNETKRKYDSLNSRLNALEGRGVGGGRGGGDDDAGAVRTSKNQRKKAKLAAAKAAAAKDGGEDSE